MLLYYITDRRAFPGDEFSRRRRLLDKVAEAAAHAVDYIQLREKDLSARDLETLAREAMHIIRKLKTENPQLKTALLVNSRVDVALSTSADGVHLPSNDISPMDVRSAWHKARGAGAPAGENSPRNPLIGISCHSPQEVPQAAVNSAAFAVFGPVFEKKDASGSAPTGLESLRQACLTPIPVLALGGITLRNATSCLEAGAAGVAAIRLFQENDVATIVNQLRHQTSAT